MDIVTVVVAWCAVWLFGVMLVLALRGPFDWAAPGEAAWTEGCGFFVGAFVLTLWMRALSAAANLHVNDALVPDCDRTRRCGQRAAVFGSTNESALNRQAVRRGAVEPPAQD